MSTTLIHKNTAPERWSTDLPKRHYIKGKVSEVRWNFEEEHGPTRVTWRTFVGVHLLVAENKTWEHTS